RRQSSGEYAFESVRKQIRLPLMEWSGPSPAPPTHVSETQQAIQSPGSTAKKRLHHNVNAALVAYVGILAELRILATA
ncbi:MAG: hypothetical protein WBL86_00950, partial [Pseudolabrys sp.]